MKCKNCKYWTKTKDDAYSIDMGTCSMLSAPDGKEYPDVNTTGIKSYPLCYHDGIGVEYETKSWFGCILFENKHEVSISQGGNDV